MLNLPDDAPDLTEILIQSEAMPWREKSLKGVAEKMLWRDETSGASIALIRFAKGAGIPQPHHHAWDFYAADSDGTNVRQLTNESFYMASALSVSPDGKSMVVVTEDLDTPRKIAIYSLDHPENRPQLFRPHVPKEADRKNPIFNCPNFMPDGKSILFMAASEGRHGYDYDVYRLDLGTGEVERLTKGNGYATDLTVFADGKTAAFLKWRSDWHATPVESELYLLDIQSHSVTPLRVSGLN